MLEDRVVGHLKDKRKEEVDTTQRENFVVDMTGKKAELIGKVEEDKGLEEEEGVVDNYKTVVQCSIHGVGMYVEVDKLASRSMDKMVALWHGWEGIG